MGRWAEFPSFGHCSANQIMPTYPITRPWLLLPLCLLLVTLQVPLAFLVHYPEPPETWMLPLIVTSVFLVPLLIFGIRAHRSETYVCHSRFALVLALYMCAGSVTGFLVDGFWAPYAFIALFFIYTFRHSLNREALRGVKPPNTARPQSGVTFGRGTDGGDSSTNNSC